MSRWLALAATPTFAGMALWTVLTEVDRGDMICSAQPGSPFSGMVVMYLLMAAFHLGPWLRVEARPRPSAETSAPPRG